MTWVRDGQGWSEVFTPAGPPRPHYGPLVTTLESFSRGDIDRRERLQTLSLISQGITFAVYGEKDGVERIFPFDFVPRIVPAAEWARLEASASPPSTCPSSTSTRSSTACATG